MKTRAFFDAFGAFFSWMWKYPTTPIENFQDARSRYKISINDEIRKILKELEDEK